MALGQADRLPKNRCGTVEQLPRQTQESVVNSRRTVILIVAVVAGAFAALGLMNYVRNVENSAGDAGAISQVWVVKAPIPRGTPAETVINQQMIGLEDVAEGLIAPTAVVDPNTELAGLVAVADLDVNMPLVTGFFASPSVIKTGVADRLEERGLVTVTFNVDQARGAAYLIEPGDRVNVLVERPWDTPFFDQETPLDLTAESTAELAEVLAESGTSRPILTDVYPVDVRFVYHNAEVLAIGTSLVPTVGQGDLAPEEQAAQDRGLVTLAVPPEAVQTILAAGRDNLYLSLVPVDYEPRAIQPQDPTRQVYPGEKSEVLTPYVEAEAAGFVAKSDLPFSDAADRIGSTPGRAGSGTEVDETTSTTAANADTTVSSNNPDAPAVTTTTAEADGEQTTTVQAEGE